MDKTGQPTKLKAWLIVLVVLLDDIAVLAVVVLALWLFDVKMPLPVIIATGVILGIIVFLVHRAVVPSLRRRKVTGAAGMVGLTAKATEPLKPAGTIKINGEYWKARATESDINAGDDVEVVGIKGLNLEVRKRKS